jgi:hypoxia up-regulated 1
MALIIAAAAIELNVLHVLQENTAAALYYARDRWDNETDHLALFYNLGASHL